MGTRLASRIASGQKPLATKEKEERRTLGVSSKIKAQNKSAKSLKTGNSRAALARNQVFNKVLTRRQAAKSAPLSSTQTEQRNTY